MKEEFYKMEFNRWDSGTIDLTLEQEAAYLRLCHQMYREHRSVKNSERMLCSIWRCHPNKARALLKALIDAGKVSVTSDGCLENSKVHAALTHRTHVGHARTMSGRLGGHASGVSRRKSLEEKETDEANASSKTNQRRVEESRVEEIRKESSAGALARVPTKERASKYPPDVEAARKAFHDRARVLKLQGSQVEQLLKAHGFHESSSPEIMLRAIQKGRKDLEASASARVPRTYLAAIIRRLGETEAAQSGVNYDPAF
jgi:hypothetical protein